jgi:hypothetical protein
MKQIGYFPEYVNENASRTVAGLVVILTLFTILTQSSILTFLLLTGFFLRTSWGPKYDPFAKLTLGWIIPTFKISIREVPGPPKRFAQFVGFIFSLTAFVLLLLNYILAFQITLSTLIIFALLEAGIGFCAGCFVFGLLMKAGIIPEEVCERCNSINYEI